MERRGNPYYSFVHVVDEVAQLDEGGGVVASVEDEGGWRECEESRVLRHQGSAGNVDFTEASVTCKGSGALSEARLTVTGTLAHLAFETPLWSHRAVTEPGSVKMTWTLLWPNEIATGSMRISHHADWKLPSTLWDLLDTRVDLVQTILAEGGLETFFTTETKPQYETTGFYIDTWQSVALESLSEVRICDDVDSASCWSNATHSAQLGPRQVIDIAGVAQLHAPNTAGFTTQWNGVSRKMVVDRRVTAGIGALASRNWDTRVVFGIACGASLLVVAIVVFCCCCLCPCCPMSKKKLPVKPVTPDRSRRGGDALPFENAAGPDDRGDDPM